jgi:hypothetical protein
MAAIVRDEPAPLNAPSNLSAVVSRCLRTLPASRFQTIHEVRAALEETTVVGADEAASIAVLPFANMSGDKEDEYFSDGLAEEILNLLTKIAGLKVIARTSSFAFRGTEQDITKIAPRCECGRFCKAAYGVPETASVSRHSSSRPRTDRISGRSATTST